MPGRSHPPQEPLGHQATLRRRVTPGDVHYLGALALRRKSGEGRLTGRPCSRRGEPLAPGARSKGSTMRRSPPIERRTRFGGFAGNSRSPARGLPADRASFDRPLAPPALAGRPFRPKLLRGRSTTLRRGHDLVPPYSRARFVRERSSRPGMRRGRRGRARSEAPGRRGLRSRDGHARACRLARG